MFKNIGKKIKTLAKIIFWLIMLIGISLAIILFVMAGSAQPWEENAITVYIILGIFSIVISFITAIFSSYFMYGFGELIDKTCDIEKNTRGAHPHMKESTKLNPSRNEKLDNLLAQGLITEEEYQNALAHS